MAGGGLQKGKASTLTGRRSNSFCQGREDANKEGGNVNSLIRNINRTCVQVSRLLARKK